MTTPGGARRRRLRLTGTKVWITNAGISTSTWCSPRPTPTAGHRGISASWSRRTGACRSPSSSTSWDCGAVPRARWSSTRCAVPASHRIGEEGQGFYIAMHTLDRSRPTIGAQAVGIAQGALDYAVGYMKERQGVRPADRRLPGPAVHGGRHGDADRGRPRPGLPGLRDRRRGRPRRRAVDDRRHGQVLRLRRGHGGDHRRRAAARRLRLHDASSPSSASCATPRSPRSTRAPTRSSGW